MRQEMAGFWDGSGISWTIFKQSALRSRQITTPTPHQSMFTGWMLFLTPNQQCQSTEGNYSMAVKLQSEIKTYKLLEAMGARTPMPPAAGNASVRWQRGTARIQPPTPLLQQSVDISCPPNPQQQAYSSVFAAMDTGQTDGHCTIS